MKKIRIYGRPIPKAKAKHQPPASKEWCGLIYSSIVEYEKTLKPKRLEGPIGIHLEFYIKHKSKAHQERLEGKYHDGKPDLDNLIKNVLDAMKGVYYQDDAQVAYIKASKHYASEEYKVYKEGVFILITSTGSIPPL